MDQLLAVCGLDCAACPAFVATKADDLAALAKLAEDWGRQFGFAATPENIRCHGCGAKDGVQIVTICQRRIMASAVTGLKEARDEIASDKDIPEDMRKQLLRTLDAQISRWNDKEG